MKRVLCVTMSILLLLPLLFTAVACGKGNQTDTTDTQKSAPTSSLPTDTSDSVGTTPAETEPGVETQPGDPDVSEDHTQTNTYLFNIDLNNIASLSEVKPEGYSLDIRTMNLVPGENGYLATGTGNDGALFVIDNNGALADYSFIFEISLCFEQFPAREGAQSFPLSLLTWIRTDATGKTSYDWAVKIDENGELYLNSTEKGTGKKLSLNVWNKLTAFYDFKNHQVLVYLDDEYVGTKGLADIDLKKSQLRVLDPQKTKFKASVDNIRAYYADETELFGKPQGSILDLATAGSSMYFAGYTDKKNALDYKVGDEIQFTIYLFCDAKVVSCPYFYYTVEGEDGQKSNGYATGENGCFTITAKLTKPGFLRVNAYVCDDNKTIMTAANSKLFITKQDSAGSKADLTFMGGASAGVNQILSAGTKPADFDAFWNGVASDVNATDLKLLRFEEVPTSKVNYDTNTFALYIVEIACGNGFATGYLSVPKNATVKSTKLYMSFVSYGVGSHKVPTPRFVGGYACFTVCAHSYKVDETESYYQDFINKNGFGSSNYGFSMIENANRDTVYFKDMIIRDLLAARFLKAYLGDNSYGTITRDGKTLAPLGIWDYSTFEVLGGSQAAFQSVAVAALDSDISFVNLSVPWFCDLAGDSVGRFPGWNPTYTDALMYYDTTMLATRVTAEVTISAGFGDDTAPASGVLALYNSLNCKKTLSMYQNRQHTYNPPMSVVSKLTSK